MKAKHWFWLAVGLQMLVLVSMIGIHSYTIWTGTPVLLKVQPMDPWDPFRGQYVRLSYDISRLSPSEVTIGGDSFRYQQTVWVTLEKAEPFWRAVSVSGSQPKLMVTPNQVVMRGVVQSYLPKDAPSWDDGPEPGTLWVRYGIEQFYVPEGEGEDLQRQAERLSVEAMVDSFGRAALHRVFLDGDEIQWR